FFFLNASAEPVGSEERDQSQGNEQGSDEREGHGVGHGMKEFSGWSSERVNRQIAGNDDRDGIKNGAIDVARGVQQNLVQLVILAMALAKLAINVFHHDDGAVNDDAEVDGSDREKVRCF